MIDRTVVGDRVELNIGFHAARTRLRILARGGMLKRASEVAYGEGITVLVELAGPAGGLTRLADVCLEDLTETDDCAHIALQWEAIGADGKLFTALLADLMLVPGGDQITALSLAGAYWPPPERAGAGLGQAIVRCCATAVIGSFVDSVACELVHPAGTAGTTGCSPVPDHTGQQQKLRSAQIHSPRVANPLVSASQSPSGPKRGPLGRYDLETTPSQDGIRISRAAAIYRAELARRPYLPGGRGPIGRSRVSRFYRRGCFSSRF